MRVMLLYRGSVVGVRRWGKGEQVLLSLNFYLIPMSELTSVSEQGLCPELGCSQHPGGKLLLPLVPAWGILHGKSYRYHRDSKKTSRTLYCKQKSCTSLLCLLLCIISQDLMQMYKPSLELGKKSIIFLLL